MIDWDKIRAALNAAPTRTTPRIDNRRPNAYWPEPIIFDLPATQRAWQDDELECR